MAEGQTSAPLEPKTLVFDSDRSLGGEAREAIPDSALAPAPNPIEAIDQWARYVWRHRRWSIAVLLALPIWLTIRIGYQVARVLGWLSHYITAPARWLYWRAYEGLGPVARFSKRLYWRLYDLCEPLRGLCTALYWRLYALCGPVARLAKQAYWRFVCPPLDLSGRAIRKAYWRVIFPVLEHPARWLGVSLVPSSQRKPRTADDAETSGDVDIATLRDGDVLVWIARSLADFEPLFDCLPRFGLRRPAAGALYIFLAPELTVAEPDQLRLLGLRLRSGAPVQRLFFYASTSETACALQEALAAPVYVAAGADTVEFAELAQQRALIEPASLTIEEFGPVVLLVTALWGRVGSTLIFDAQTEFLIENGAVVVRIFVDHNPGYGAERLIRRNTLVAENLAATYPHLFVVAERDENRRVRTALHRRRDYVAASAVRRLELELTTAKALDEGVLRWAGAAARLCVVNHAMHMAFAERITRAPIVLETHDVLTEQTKSHGWPDFVSFAKEPQHLRERDQQAIWRRAKACVNLTPEDQSVIAPYAQASAFVRPTAVKGAPRLREWKAVISANNLPPGFAASEQIDILLWGDWHEGNARAVQWVLETVRDLDPALAAARIAIIGRVTRLLPEHLKRHPNVVSCDFVDRLDDFFGRAKVLAIADQDASGVSIKAIEALRYGMPFVSTRHGMRGLDLVNVDYDPADTAAAFAADLAALLEDESARAGRAQIARALYERNISHDAYEDAWRTIIATADPEFSTARNMERLSRAPRATAPGPANQIARFTGSARRAPGTVVPTASAVAPASDLATRPIPPVRSTHSLAAVICTYNRYDVLPGAIESLLAQDISGEDLDILVIDNSPDQEAAAAFGSRYRGTRVRYLLEPTPGLSNARNVGANASGAKYVAYIDDDAVAASNWATNLLAALHRFSPRAGVAGGRIVPRWVTPRPDWLPDELIGNLSIVDWGGVARPLGRAEWIAGCNIAFDRRMLLELGGFSRALGRVGSGAALLSNEESEVIEKFAGADRIAIYAPEAMVEHLIEPARLSQEWFRRRAAWQAVSDYIKDPKRAAAYSGAAAERLRRELEAEDDAVPPGFVRANVGRETFRRDVGLMYDVVIAMLSGGVELSESGSPASLQDKLVANVRREVQRNPKLREAIRKLASF